MVSEKSTREHSKVYDRTLRGIRENSINRNINTLDTIDQIIQKGSDTFDIIDTLSTLPLAKLQDGLNNNPYYVKKAIALKKENEKPKVEFDTGSVLKKLAKEKNPQYHMKKQYNIRNNIKPWKK